MRQRIPFVAVILAAGLRILTLGAADDPIATMLSKRALAAGYNPVLLDFLLEEGKTRLTEAETKEAVSQQVEELKRQVDVKPGEQIAASLATAVGLLTGGTVGEGARSGASDVWNSWVDSGFVLLRAGYTAEATAFFERCISVFPDERAQQRCAAGLAAADPERGYATLTGLLTNSQPIETQGAALRLLGALAGADGCPEATRDAVLAELNKRTEGMMNVSLGPAVVGGLVLMNDPRAVEPLRKMTKGMTRGEDVKRAALAGLALRYKDPGAFAELQKQMKGGFASKEWDKVWAGLVLIRAGQTSGTDWAREYLTKKRGGLLSTDKEDYSSHVVEALAEVGGEGAKAALAAGIAAHKPDEWITAFMSICLYELGDTSRADAVKAALAKKDWPRTQALAATALAEKKDYSGIPTLAAMVKDVGAGTKAAQLALGTYKDPEAARIAAADALGRIDHADCVPILMSLLDDGAETVRLTAAFGLMRMKDPAALTGLEKVLATDFGTFDGRPRAPQVHANAVRTAGLVFGGDASRSLLQSASASPVPAVRFLAFALMRPKTS